MRLTECSREPELVEAFAEGRWPDACDEDLRRHADQCAVCADVLEVASSMQDDYRSAIAEVQVPSASLVWWRAELRARHEAARTAARPITVVHAFAAAAAVGVILALGGLLVPVIQGWFGGLSTILPPTVGAEASFLPMAGVPFALPAILGIGCCLLLAPLAVYFILSEK